MSELREEIKNLDDKRRVHIEANVLKSRANGALLEMKRLCDKMIENHLGNVRMVSDLEVCLNEIREIEFQLHEYRLSIGSLLEKPT